MTMSDTTIPAPLNALVDVVNDGDTEGFLSLLTDDAVIDDNGTRYAGKAAIKTWSDRELIGANGVWTVDAVEEHADKIHLISDWKSDYYTGPGQFVFTLRDQRITGWTIGGV